MWTNATYAGPRGIAFEMRDPDLLVNTNSYVLTGRAQFGGNCTGISTSANWLPGQGPRSSEWHLNPLGAGSANGSHFRDPKLAFKVIGL
jgi:hypothetical protein